MGNSTLLKTGKGGWKTANYRMGKIRAGERVFRVFAESTIDLIVRLDRKLNYLYVNPAVEKLFGLTKDKIIGRNYQEIGLTDDESAICKTNFMEVFQTGESRGFDACFKRSGEVRWFCCQVLPEFYRGMVVSALAVFRDVTRRKMMEEELRISRDLFLKAFRSNPAGMAIIKLSDLVCVDVNQSWTKITGYTREESVGRPISELGLVDPDELVEIIGAVVWDGKIEAKKGQIRTKPGEPATVIETSDVIDFAGERCILSSMIDISERTRLERELARLDRLSLVGEMAASIGHEIRNPLTTIRGYLQMFQAKNMYDGHSDVLALMIEELDKANAVITEFLSLAKNKAVNLRLIDLNRIIDNLYPRIQSDVLQKGNALCIEKDEIPLLYLDESEIRHMLINLVRNGLEAMPEGGMIGIKTVCSGREVLLVVEDEGPGIDPCLLEHLGTPFLTTKANGVGLGLAVCYSIAARHEAKIDVATGPQGTAITVRFKIP